LLPEECEKLRSTGVLADKVKAYQMEYLCKVFQVECPIIVVDGKESGVIFSTVKLQYRPYPSHVYLFAVLLCLIGNSMRRAAKKIARLFGIPHFSHSTISRCFARLEKELPQLEGWDPESDFDFVPPIELPPVNPAVHKAIINPAGPGSIAQLIIPRYRQDSRKSLCVHLFRILRPILSVPEAGNHILFAFWKRFGRLLL
jgi:xanthosine utilization system XapX-like protein